METLLRGLKACSAVIADAWARGTRRVVQEGGEDGLGAKAIRVRARALSSPPVTAIISDEEIGMTVRSLTAD